MNKSSRQNPYEDLANAIILLAVKDYRSAAKRLAKGRKNKEAKKIYDECRRFFLGEWFSVLTDLDPEYLI